MLAQRRQPPRIPERRAVTPYELEERETSDPGIVLVETVGELDLTNVAEVEHRLEDVSSRVDGMLLDLNRVSFVDSAALHMLFRIARRLGTERFAIVLEPSGAIARTFDIVGLDRLARIGSSVDELLPALGG
jgi:anti-anti-sigma factor